VIDFYKKLAILELMVQYLINQLKTIYLNTFIQYTRHRRMAFKIYTDIYNSDSGGGGGSVDSNIIDIYIKRSMKTIIIYAECSCKTAIFFDIFCN
jgi:hypothetical protein